MSRQFTVGWVVTFAANRRQGRLRTSVLVERPLRHPRYPGADFIAAQLVARACLLLRVPPQDLRITGHPADGKITRIYDV